MSNDVARDQNYESPTGCLLRLFWLLAGNALLAFALLQILFSGASLFSWVDAFFWSIVGLVIAARFVDITYFKGTTAGGQDASFYHGWRFVVMYVTAAGAAWLAAHMAVN